MSTESIPTATFVEDPAPVEVAIGDSSNPELAKSASPAQGVPVVAAMDAISTISPGSPQAFAVPCITSLVAPSTSTGMHTARTATAKSAPASHCP